MQHYIRPKFATDGAPLLITADSYCYQMPAVYMTPWRQRTTSSVYTCCGYAVLHVAIGE